MRRLSAIGAPAFLVLLLLSSVIASYAPGNQDDKTMLLATSGVPLGRLDQIYAMADELLIGCSTGSVARVTRCMNRTAGRIGTLANYPATTATMWIARSILWDEWPPSNSKVSATYAAGLLLHALFYILLCVGAVWIRPTPGLRNGVIITCLASLVISTLWPDLQGYAIATYAPRGALALVAAFAAISASRSDWRLVCILAPITLTIHIGQSGMVLVALGIFALIAAIRISPFPGRRITLHMAPLIAGVWCFGLAVAAVQFSRSLAVQGSYINVDSFMSLLTAPGPIVRIVTLGALCVVAGLSPFVRSRINTRIVFAIFLILGGIYLTDVWLTLPDNDSARLLRLRYLGTFAPIAIGLALDGHLKASRYKTFAVAITGALILRNLTAIPEAAKTVAHDMDEQPTFEDLGPLRKVNPSDEVEMHLALLRFLIGRE